MNLLNKVINFSLTISMSGCSAYGEGVKMAITPLSVLSINIFPFEIYSSFEDLFNLFKSYNSLLNLFVDKFITSNLTIISVFTALGVFKVFIMILALHLTRTTYFLEPFLIHLTFDDKNNNMFVY